MVRAHAPFGQRGDLYDVDGWLKKAALLKKKPHWPFKHVPSFETWAAATCYDYKESDGGIHFQRMMFWVMAPNRVVGKDTHKLPEEGFKFCTFTEKTIVGKNDKKPFEETGCVLPGNKESLYWTTGGSGQPAKAYAGENLGDFHIGAFRGGPLQSGTGHDRPFDAPGWKTRGAGVDGNEIRRKQVGTSVKTWGIKAWWEMTGMATQAAENRKYVGDKCSDRDNLGRVELAPWAQKGGRLDNLQSNGGCVSLHIRLAAYFGLYYYQNCRDERVNWTVKVSDGRKKSNKTYYVRMRMPNPRYIIEEEPGDKWGLYVAEPVSKFSKDTDKDRPFDPVDKNGKRINITGKNPLLPENTQPQDLGDHPGKFEFPRIHEGAWFWDKIAFKQEASQGDKSKKATKAGIYGMLGPWAGVPGDGPDAVKVHYAEMPSAQGAYADSQYSARLWDTWYDALEGTYWDGRVDLRDDYADDPGNWGKQVQGLAFGWSMPLATFLWPHDKGGKQIVTMHKSGHVNVPFNYQNWPTWRDDKYTGNDFSKEDGFDVYSKPFVWYLEGAPRKRDAEDSVLWSDVHKKEHNLAINDERLYLDRSGKPTVAPKPPAPKPAAPITMDEAEGSAPDENEDGGRTDVEGTSRPGPESMEVAGVEENEMGGEAELVVSTAQEAGDEWLLDAIKKGDLVSEQRALKNHKTGETLKPGSERRQQDGAFNYHFYSLEWSPWAPGDVYVKPELKFNYKPMSSAQVEEYEKRYGSATNTLLRSSYHREIDTDDPVQQGGGQPKMINGKSILDLPIDSYKDLTGGDAELFRKNMKRILSIYFDTSGKLGSKGSGVSYSPVEKRDGMRNGLWRTQEVCKQGEGAGCKIMTGDHSDYIVKSGPRKGEVRLDQKKRERILRPVFNNTHDELKGLEAAATDGGKLWRGGRAGPQQRMDVDFIRSNMTVREWLASPWHYEHLPYRFVHSVFKDGETYCAGCTRCSRPFYEYKYLYAHYLQASEYTTHWPYLYWRTTEDRRIAPEPFHEGKFWSDDVMPPDVKAGKGYGLDGGDDGVEMDSPGYHLWMTHAFLLGWKQGADDRLVKDPSGVLKLEWEKRNRIELKNTLLDKYQKGMWWVFRQYINHMYQWADGETDDGMQSAQGSVMLQGAMRSARNKVTFGMTGYKLMRSVKYGNVCRDCMNVLDLAPNLYTRTGKVTMPADMHRRGMERGIRQMDTWWLQLKDATIVGPTSGQTWAFDPWFIYANTGGIKDVGDAPDKTPKNGRTRNYVFEQLRGANPQMTLQKRYEIDTAQVKQRANRSKVYRLLWPGKQHPEKEKAESFWETHLRLHMDVATEWVKRNSCDYTSPDGTPLTKHARPPEVYVQKTFDAPSDEWQKHDAEAMSDALKFLLDLEKHLDALYLDEDPDPPSFELSKRGNRALYDALKDVTYTLAHMTNYKQDDESTLVKFDADLMRDEWRNWVQQDEDQTWDKCLRVRQIVKPAVRKPDEVEPGDQLGKPEFTEPVWREVVYRYDSEDGGKHTDWRGDGYVEAKKLDASHGVKEKNGVYQQRRYAQSRVFITYSLHRRAGSEEEARGILEKMADAVRLVFGNDQQLCRIVSFGMKVGGKMSTDSISARQYEPILKPRKDATVFYGGTGNSNSYLYDTYQTHVESVSVDAGIEIGPTLLHPHFHVLLTINHWSYVQIDTFRMKAIFEQLFKGTHMQYADTFKLLDAGGLPFYTDNENPYVDIRMYPTDNWADVLAAYVRKGADKQSMMALRARSG